MSFLAVSSLLLLATLSEARANPTPYDLYDPNLFAADAVNAGNELSMLAIDTAAPEDWSLLDEPTDFVDTAPDGIPLILDDSPPVANWDDSGTENLLGSCAADMDPTMGVGKFKLRREDGSQCANPGTTDSAPMGEQNDKPPLQWPNLLDLPSLDDPLVLPADPPEDKTQCPSRFPLRLCCDGPLGAVAPNFLLKTVQNCSPCQYFPRETRSHGHHIFWMIEILQIYGRVRPYSTIFVAWVSR